MSHLVEEAYFDGTNKGDQFKCVMILEDNPFNCGVAISVEHQMVLAVQNAGRNFLAFPHPEMLRSLAGHLVMQADLWERGEIAGLKVPE